MKIGLIIWAFIVLSSHAIAQNDSSYQLIKTYPISVTDAVMDNLDNLYLITSQDQLKKYDANGDSVGVFNGVKRFGKLYAVDVANPLKLLLFYKDFSNVVILDRLLAVRATVDLRRINILQTSAISSSYDNNIWVFDRYVNKLKKIDEQGNLLLETPDFRVLFDQSVIPQQILDRDGFVYLYDSAGGVYQFDYYGTFKRRLPLTNQNNIVVAGKNIWGVCNKGISYYSTSTLMEKYYPFPQNFVPEHKYYLTQNKLIVLSKDSISVFSYKY